MTLGIARRHQHIVALKVYSSFRSIGKPPKLSEKKIDKGECILLTIVPSCARSVDKASIQSFALDSDTWKEETLEAYLDVTYSVEARHWTSNINISDSHGRQKAMEVHNSSRTQLDICK